VRSAAAPRVQHDATVQIESSGGGDTFVARSVNLSVGGLFVVSDTLLPPGESVDLKLNLRDGGVPVDARARVVWVRPEEGEAHQGMAVRFVGLTENDMRRIGRVVASARREPTGVQRRDVRIRLPSLTSPLRAVARDETEDGLMLEAELPWLRLGSPVTAELGPETTRHGLVSWVGLDVTRGGAARLRIAIDLNTCVDGPMGPQPPVVAHPFEPDEKLKIPRTARWPWLMAMVLVAGAAFSGAWFLRPPPQPLLLASPQTVETPAKRAQLPPLVKIPKAPADEPAPAPARRARRNK
jgi:uncharacterized protein (TIGR02266 family)